MRTPEEQFQTMREQVIAKIHWGTSTEEVRGWLYEKHHLDENTAEALISEAVRLKRHAVRQKARYSLVISLAGMFLALVCLYIRFFATDTFFRLRPVALIGALVFAALSVPAFFRSLNQLVSGEKAGSVD